jgi:hypothetical protein
MSRKSETDNAIKKGNNIDNSLSPGLSLSENGRKAARLLWEKGLDAVEITDPFTFEYSNGALTELERLQRETPEILRDVLQGAQISAEQLSVDSFHGLLEIIQNADDLRASEVRVAIRSVGNQKHLLIVHNGARVQLQHVIAMSLAFISTKRNDSRAKGRFGIGLKTLGRLGSVLSVYCTPYNFRIEENQVKSIPPPKPIRGFYDPNTTDTLLDLKLYEEIDSIEFQEWFGTLGAESLIFLDSVQSLRLDKIGHSETIIHHQLGKNGIQEIKSLDMKSSCRRTILKSKDGQIWDRYETDVPLPANIRRHYKAQEPTTPIAIAIPRKPSKSKIYAGLPVADIQLPFNINAQFDPDTSRRGIVHAPLNEWLIGQIAKLASSIALYRLKENSPSAWTAIPLKEESSFPDNWVMRQLDSLSNSIQDHIRRQFQILIDDEQISLKKLAYEKQEINQLLSQSDINELRHGLKLLPLKSRDTKGRWRKVLTQLGIATPISVKDSLNLLRLEDQKLVEKDVSWFIKLACAALEDDLGGDLWLLRSVITSDGTRIVPPLPGYEGELLLKKSESDSLASNLGIIHEIHPLYLQQTRESTTVRTWLEEEGMLREIADAESILKAIASHKWNNQFPQINDHNLLLIKDALGAVEQNKQRELGLSVGKVILVETQSWDGKKRVNGFGKPCDAYLPASIEDRKDGWSKAAGSTPSLYWIHPRYHNVVRRSGIKQIASSKSKTIGTRTLFSLLGAENCPRLVEPTHKETRYGDPATPVYWYRISASQREALNKFIRRPSHLKNDRLSPDLVVVLADIQKENKVRLRRERARALLMTMEREWERVYAKHTLASAVWSYMTWHTLGTAPSSWISSAMDEPWLTSEDGKKKPPRELAVRTPATEAIFGNDKSLFASEVTIDDARLPIVKALKIKTDPEVSEIIDQLVTIRDSEVNVEEQLILLRYAAIASNIKKRELDPNDLIGNVTLKQLKNHFSNQRNRRGLIYTNHGWLPPSKVFLGNPIFGRYAPFVSEKSSAAPLWRALKISHPTINDCVQILRNIAKRNLENDDEVILVNIYYYLEQQLSKASPRERGSLQNIPLWDGFNWQTKRPIFVVENETIFQKLSTQVPLWKIPVSTANIPKLIDEMKVTVLSDENFVPIAHKNSFQEGIQLLQQFSATVGLLKDRLSRQDPKLFNECSVSWDELANAKIGIDPNLEVELQIPSHSPISISARAHLTQSPLTVFFADVEAAEEYENGGRVISELFKNADKEKIALLWGYCWEKAAKGKRGAVSIIEDSTEETALKDLYEQAKRKTKIPPPKNPKSNTPVIPLNYNQDPPPARQLKKIENIGDKALKFEWGSSQSSEPSSTARRGLRSSIPSGNKIGAKRPVSRTAPLAYSSEEKEALALDILQHAINGNDSELRDFRHLRGVGADALDKIRRFFEIKSSFGEMPDTITLTANEAERALQEGENFFLALVAGLEEGYETVIKIVPNPLKNLTIQKNTSVTLTGVTRANRTLTACFSDLILQENNETDKGFIISNQVIFE